MLKITVHVAMQSLILSSVQTLVNSASVDEAFGKLNTLGESITFC